MSPISASYDVIIIGAGINGAGIAHDAAQRGLRVLLLDKGDIASGTTSWSTRLIHGGLRYLEHAELRLVRESLRERETLLRIAPHLVRPLPLLIPLYKGARRGPFTMRVGMVAYDVLSWNKSLPRHQMLSSTATLARASGLRTEDLQGGALYYDAQVTFPERLTVENVLAAHALGAHVLTYTRADSLLTEQGQVRGIVCTNLQTGAQHTAHAPLVVNVAGPWVDAVLAGALPAGTPLVAGTKGTHLVVAPFAGAPQVGLYAEAKADGRPFFILPWNELYLIGTTDTRYTGSLEQLEATQDEIAYLLAETNRLFPQAHLTSEQVLYTYAGVRPLPFVPAGSEAGITRRHFVHQDSAGIKGLFSIVGGKLTTYRSLAEEVVDLLCQRLQKPCMASVSAQTPLPGALPPEEIARFQQQLLQVFPALPNASLHRLLRIYGRRAAPLLQLAATSPNLLQPLVPNSPTLAAEIVFAMQQELAQTLTDCLLRRTMLGLNAACGLDVVEAAATVARQHLGWSAAREATEVAAYRQYVQRFHPHSLVAAGD
ncbi:glycerol-3-phosphate dehydrogenase [Hymenobacter sp. BT730]|uniref:glycerol-3-phosphate dehydrogenase n=1 Tax=Hymenobacter sp. BT730 TaxID=3063332 RepID=UPI0026DEC217|nr:glycerol-3-phosphate dehydrogenase [Hymenobacter sp. BT730]